MKLKYLRYTLDYGLHYVGYPTMLHCYGDAKLVYDTKCSKSISGHIVTLGVIVVSCKSSKKICFTRSTKGSEFIALDKAREEAE